MVRYSKKLGKKRTVIARKMHRKRGKKSVKSLRRSRLLKAERKRKRKSRKPKIGGDDPKEMNAFPLLKGILGKMYTDDHVKLSKTLSIIFKRVYYIKTLSSLYNDEKYKKEAVNHFLPLAQKLNAQVYPPLPDESGTAVDLEGQTKLVDPLGARGGAANGASSGAKVASAQYRFPGYAADIPKRVKVVNYPKASSTSADFWYLNFIYQFLDLCEEFYSIKDHKERLPKKIRGLFSGTQLIEELARLEEADHHNPASSVGWYTDDQLRKYKQRITMEINRRQELIESIKVSIEYVSFILNGDYDRKHIDVDNHKAVDKVYKKASKVRQKMQKGKKIKGLPKISHADLLLILQPPVASTSLPPPPHRKKAMTKREKVMTIEQFKTETDEAIKAGRLPPPPPTIVEIPLEDPSTSTGPRAITAAIITEEIGIGIASSAAEAQAQDAETQRARASSRPRPADAQSEIWEPEVHTHIDLGDLLNSDETLSEKEKKGLGEDYKNQIIEKIEGMFPFTKDQIEAYLNSLNFTDLDFFEQSVQIEECLVAHYIAEIEKLAKKKQIDDFTFDLSDLPPPVLKPVEEPEEQSTKRKPVPTPRPMRKLTKVPEQGSSVEPFGLKYPKLPKQSANPAEFDEYIDAATKLQQRILLLTTSVPDYSTTLAEEAAAAAAAAAEEAAAAAAAAPSEAAVEAAAAEAVAVAAAEAAAAEAAAEAEAEAAAEAAAALAEEEAAQAAIEEANARMEAAKQAIAKASANEDVRIQQAKDNDFKIAVIKQLYPIHIMATQTLLPKDLYITQKVIVVTQDGAYCSIRKLDNDNVFWYPTAFLIIEE